METVNSGAVSAPFYDAVKADVIVVIGANPTVNHPVAATFFKNAVKDGVELIVMDPRGQALSRHATHMLQFKGGTDVALLNAIMHTIVDERLTNANYIESYTEGFEELKLTSLVSRRKRWPISVALTRTRSAPSRANTPARGGASSFGAWASHSTYTARTMRAASSRSL